MMDWYRMTKWQKMGARAELDRITAHLEKQYEEARHGDVQADKHRTTAQSTAKTDKNA